MTARTQTNGRALPRHGPPAYERIAAKLSADQCVVLDGAMGTELPRAGSLGDDESLWGTRALIDAPRLVADVHRRYVEAGCDVITTNTWGLIAALDAEAPPLRDGAGAPAHWMDLARRGLRLAHEAAAERTEEDRCAVAFSLNGELDSPRGRETIRLLARLFSDEPDPPDLILAETLSVLSDSLHDTVGELVATGLPVWLSFRRCRHGLCSVYGQHWGGPEGDAFGRAARRFEEMGVAALLINCIPPDHVDGVVSYLRDFTDLPLGVYPNLGYLTDQGWRSDPGVGGEEYGEASLRWRSEGARIVGGCCGVGPEHVAVARERLEGTKPGRERPPPLHASGSGAGAAATLPRSDGPIRAPAPPPWRDDRKRCVYPLPFPELVVDSGVHAPDEASFMAWRYLFREGIGAHQRCLDAGCGTGILAVQLALNGAAHTHAIDIDRRAVANTLTNAFRNGVDSRLSAAVVDLYPWVPDERYEVIVARLQQRPVNPFEALSTHRRADYWGRHLVDQLIGKLGEALAPEGVAYIVQLSILSQQRTSEFLEAAGFASRVVDMTMFGVPPVPEKDRAQLERVEELSDAYHLTVGTRDVFVAYLLEVTANAGGQLAQVRHDGPEDGPPSP